MRYLIARLREPSTYAGIGAALMPFMPYYPTLAYAAAGMGVLAVLMRDPAQTPPAE